MHVLRGRVAAFDEMAPILEGRSGLRYRQGVSDAHERRLELLQPALVRHGKQTCIAHKRLTVDELDVLRRNGRPAEGFTVLPLRGGTGPWLQWSAEGLRAWLYQGRSPLGNRPCQAMRTPAPRCLGVLWTWTGILHAVDGVCLLRPLHVHTAIGQPLDLTSEQKLHRLLNPRVTLRQDTFRPLAHFADCLVEQELGQGVSVEPVFNATLIGSRALAAYDDVDGPSAANNRPWSRKYTARLLRRSDASASAHGYVGTRSVRLEG